jgi:hypothetical protein
MATTFNPSFRPTRTRILLIALAVALLLGYGLFTAQQARSATLTKKAFAGVKVSGGTATLVHASHVTGATRLSTGTYKVAFDRHVDNCSFSAAVDFHGGVANFALFFIANGPFGGFSTSHEVVVVDDARSPDATMDTDFDIIALCPGT